MSVKRKIQIKQANRAAFKQVKTEALKLAQQATKDLSNVGIIYQFPDDPVNHPAHYRAGDIYETIRVIEAWKLNFRLGTCVKYISRADSKGQPVQDLEKARWYLDREIANRKAAR